MSKSGANVDFRALSGNRFEVTLPRGMTCSRAARAIFAARGMALDGAIPGGFPGEKNETPSNKVCRLAREAGLEGEKMSEFERALVNLCEHRDAGTERGGGEANVNIEVEEGEDGEIEQEEAEEELPRWASDPQERGRRWRALDKFLRARGAGDADLDELQQKWVPILVSFRRTR